MVTDDQFNEMHADIKRLSARSIPVPPKKNGPDWTNVVKAILAVGGVVGSIVIGYIVQTKADAATEHKEITKETAKNFETKTHAKETHDRHDKQAEKITGQIDALYKHVIERKPRRDVRVNNGGEDGH